MSQLTDVITGDGLIGEIKKVEEDSLTILAKLAQVETTLCALSDNGKEAGREREKKEVR
jgi:preprotein translocase subunit YajC